MSVELLHVMGDDLMVVNAARVSMGKHHDEFDEIADTRLIRYLARNGHWTPFAQPQIQFRVKAPIFVARQWFRSNVGTIRNEVSRRYVSDMPTFFDVSFRTAPEGSIKQGSGGPVTPEVQREAAAIQTDIELECMKVYLELLDMGIAPEQARAILPQTMMTEWIETGSLAYWARFVDLRSDTLAQGEIQDYANQISELIYPHFPVSWEALRKAR